MRITAAKNKVFKRIHDGYLFSNEIVLGKDYSTGIEREDLPEYYEEVQDPDAPTPPQLSTLRVPIPQEWEIIFPDDKFIINGFEVQLERVKGVLAVDVAYLDWQPFKDELDKPENATVKRSLEGVWDYVKKQYDLHNFI
jgi:hypothetical protein